MIITEQKTMKEILQMLEPYKKIVVVGCGGCATFYGTGSKFEAERMVEILEIYEKEVVSLLIIPRMCDIDMVKGRLSGNVEDAEAIACMGCGIGTQAVAEVVENKAVLPLLNTKFAGTVVGSSFQERCVACGECILHLTGGICPVARCAKGLMNGPCGGMKDGKCEIGYEQDCGWYLVYEKLKKLGKLEDFRRIIPSKSKSLTTKPKRMAIDASIKICPVEEEEAK